MYLKSCLVAVFVVSFFAAAAQRPDFSGTWVIDLQQSGFGKAPRSAMPAKLVVTQTAGHIRVSGSDTVQLAFDSTATQTKPEGVQRKSRVKWSGDTVVFTENVTIYHMDAVAFTETWSLADAGQTLVADRSVVYENGFSYTIHAFYRKQL